MTRLDSMPGTSERPTLSFVTRRLGFTLPEVIVSLLIVALLASFVIPAVFTNATAARVDAIVNEFENLETGILLYKNDVGRYPRRLDYLNVLPAGTLKDACNVNLSAGNQAKYRGPYISRPIVLLDALTLPWYVMSTGDSVVATLTVQPSFQGQRVIQIKVNGPELDIARGVDAKIDGIEAFNAGKLQYSDNGGVGVNTNMEKGLTYTIAIPAGTC